MEVLQNNVVLSYFHRRQKAVERGSRPKSRHLILLLAIVPIADRHPLIDSVTNTVRRLAVGGADT